MRIETIQELAEEFGASLEATAVNIVRAGIEDVAVLVWELGWNKKQAKEAKESEIPSLWGEEDSFASPPKSYRIKFACTCGEFNSFYFPRNKSIAEDSLIYQAAETERPVCGFQSLPVGGEETQIFYTQSQSFLVRKNDEYEKKVFTLVQMRPPEDDD